MKPLNSIFEFDQTLLKKLSTDTTEQQKLWLSGYLYGLYASGQPADNGLDVLEQEQPTASVAKPKLTILYGSHTGNGKKIAEQAVSQAEARGFEVDLQDMNDYNARRLKEEQVLLVIVSTHGEGEPPIAAETLHEFIHSSRAPKLDKTKFAVLALGDSSYAYFCQTGKEFDEQFAKLGATRLVERVDCDVDFEEPAARWLDDVLAKIEAEVAVPQATNGQAVVGNTQPQVAVSKYGRKNPFPATILEKIQLNGRGSVKETWHVEIGLEASGLAYEPGDSLGIYAENPPELVGLVLKNAGVAETETVEWNGEKLSVHEVLTQYLELNLISRDVLEKISQKNQDAKLQELISDPKVLQTYIYGRDIADVLAEFPAEWSPQELVDSLRKLQPRLYSIASSLQATPEEAHLTISAVRYENFGRKRTGTASTFMADALQVGQQVQVFVERNEFFKLPKDGNTPIIMVGAVTGVAPYRAFLQERAETGAKGKNWLFFGNPNFTTDFLYQTEWQRALKSGLLTKLDVAFSRDQAEKVYCQHKLMQRAREVFEWLENGAVFYICGDKSRLAPDVEKALIQVVAQEGNLDEAAAQAYVKDLKKQRRYLEDVY